MEKRTSRLILRTYCGAGQKKPWQSFLSIADQCISVFKKYKQKTGVRVVFWYMSETIKNLTAKKLISLGEARLLVADLPPLAQEKIGLEDALGRRVGHDIPAQADCPSVDASLKDGFAVHSADVATASADTPVRLRVVDMVAAGSRSRATVGPGQAIRIMTGAPVPAGADAVLASEFVRENDGHVEALADAHPGRNILALGSDVARGELIVGAGTRLGPTHLGLLAAAGVNALGVYRRPEIMVVATGSELVAPGESITSGRVAASNMITLVAELRCLGLDPHWLLIRDDLDSLCEQIAQFMGRYDCVLTCGGVLDGDKDYTMQAMQELRIEPIFQRVRIGPGKGICLGHSEDGSTLFINLPGGPPSNHVAFVLLARPCIQRLEGCEDPFAGAVAARLLTDIRGQVGWTQLYYGRLSGQGVERCVRPITGMSRLAAMAEADCLIELPENQESASRGSTVQKIWKIR